MYIYRYTCTLMFRIFGLTSRFDTRHNLAMSVPYTSEKDKKCNQTCIRQRTSRSGYRPGEPTCKEQKRI